MHLQKGDIGFYRKRIELSHDSGILHLADKFSPSFRTQKNGVKNATVTQWGQPQPSARCTSGRKSSSELTHTQEKHVTQQ